MLSERGGTERDRFVIGKLCNQCGMCIKNCPAGAIVREYAAYRIVQECCVGCGRCERLCRTRAIYRVKGEK